MMLCNYLMECDSEGYRLDIKTNDDVVTDLAVWAGLREGMRVADVACGSGRSTVSLKNVVGADGYAVGIDASASRIEYARQKFSRDGIEYIVGNVLSDLPEAGKFDFIWVRFLLEYYRMEALPIVEAIKKMLNPGGLVCLVDLDYNSLNHFDAPPQLEHAIRGILMKLHDEANFDPYIGRKLYSLLYDSGCSEIRARIDGHHLVYGPISDPDLYNWRQKLEIAARNSGYDFRGYPGGYEQFSADFLAFIQDPRRFTYSPQITVVGRNVS